MKTKQFIYGVIYFIIIAISIVTEHFITALLFMLLAGSDYLIIKKDKTISQLTSKLTDAEKEVSEWKNKHANQLSSVWDLSNIIIELQSESRRLDETIFDLIQSLQQRTESAQKWEAYVEKERARGREKYNRLYKGKKKAVATEQKIEPKKIEPFRMVVNPKQSAIVQQILFDNGYEWMNGDKDVINIKAKAICFHDNKISMYSEYPSKSSAYFEQTDIPKLSFKKFMQLYGAKEQPYKIEGKTIKQLVEENLGIEVNIEHYGLFFLCGYDKEFEDCDIHANWSPFLIGNDKISNSSFHKDRIILKNYSNIEWSNSQIVINAIKKHRNIQ